MKTPFRKIFVLEKIEYIPLLIAVPLTGLSIYYLNQESDELLKYIFTVISALLMITALVAWFSRLNSYLKE